MKSRWNDAEAANYTSDLQQRVYTSRLLGRDQELVMHGGGNTSVKITQENVFGEPEEILYVKGSGWDLATIEAPGFAPVRMDAMLRLAKLDELSDSEMANQLKCSMINASAPGPSVESILHAILPYTFVDHTHANALISVCNTPNGEEKVRDIFGDTVIMIPYIMPGFKLARYCADAYPAQVNANMVGMVLMNHGLFTFADTAKDAYEKMIDMTDRLEQYLMQHDAWQIAIPDIYANQESTDRRLELAQLRHDLSALAGKPMILRTDDSPHSLHFTNHPEVARISQQGTATPDHIIRTKRVPMIGRDLVAYQTAYEQYFAENDPLWPQDLTMLDPAPRVILDPELGMIAVGDSIKAANISRDIYGHTIDMILRAEKLDSFRSLSAAELFEVEYWELEQAKLKKGGSAPVLTGEVAVVTGAASGIGKACAETLLQRGAAVIGLDISASVTDVSSNAAYLGLVCDLTDEASIGAALEEGVKMFGGVDMVVLNAGIFPSSQQIKDLTTDAWRRSMDINLDANLFLMRALHPLLKLAPRGGKVAIIGTKNIPAPGPGAGAYSAAKAALNQLARVAAMEWAADGIRVNVVHPNGVFDTGIWTDEILQTRAEAYGLTTEQYKTRNLMGVEVTSYDVAAIVADLCGPNYAKTTGAQIPIDGGDNRVI
ncbi:MAG: bifunctional aldolase/short-chain dehydrogenase [Chloroflexota bacterium]